MSRFLCFSHLAGFASALRRGASLHGLTTGVPAKVALVGGFATPKPFSAVGGLDSACPGNVPVLP